MGQVYQATDTKLNRQVALKILPEAFATDPDRLARFQREAQVLASLNHPNIAAIHGLEESEGTRALVLELVEGPTLADRIAQGPIPIDEALPIAKQIAEALEAAHETGVIHRDLKPANIKVREDRTVKVLDFGLAKALDTTPEGDPSQSPTLTAAATQMGVILGTAAYMSPEQERGKPVDKRSDIWAFGVVLFEMLAGQRVFGGGAVSETLADVMKSPPSWELLSPDVPATLTNVLRRCLEKDPRQRMHDIADVRLAMSGAFETAAGAPPLEATARHSAGWRQARPWVLGAVILGGVITGLAIRALTPSPSRPITRLSVSVPPSVPLELGVGNRNHVAISPNGTVVVYRGGEDSVGLYVRAIDQIEAVPLRGAEQGDSPFLSPGGQWVGFTGESGRSLQKVSVLGGPSITITELPANLRGAS